MARDFSARAREIIRPESRSVDPSLDSILASRAERLSSVRIRSPEPGVVLQRVDRRIDAAPASGGAPRRPLQMKAKFYLGSAGRAGDPGRDEPAWGRVRSQGSSGDPVASSTEGFGASWTGRFAVAARTA